MRIQPPVKDWCGSTTPAGGQLHTHLPLPRNLGTLSEHVLHHGGKGEVGMTEDTYPGTKEENTK